MHALITADHILAILCWIEVTVHCSYLVTIVIIFLYTMSINVCMLNVFKLLKIWGTQWPTLYCCPLHLVLLLLEAHCVCGLVVRVTRLIPYTWRTWQVSRVISFQARLTLRVFFHCCENCCRGVTWVRGYWVVRSCCYGNAQCIHS